MKYIRYAMAVIGAILVYCAVSTSDYYVIELEQTEPAFIWPTIIIGFIMMIPTVIHLIAKEREDYRG